MRIDRSDLSAEPDAYVDLDARSAPDQPHAAGKDQAKVVAGDDPPVSSSASPDPPWHTERAAAYRAAVDAAYRQYAIDHGNARVEEPERETAAPAMRDRDRPPEVSALEADLRELKAEYEAGLAELKAELHALRDRPEAIPDGPGGTGSAADQPRAEGMPAELNNPEEAEHQDDRPGWWSNAKTALYGGVTTSLGLAAADQFAPWAPHSVVDIAAGAVTVATLLVPTLREGWRRNHDDAPDKR